VFNHTCMRMTTLIRATSEGASLDYVFVLSCKRQRGKHLKELQRLLSLPRALAEAAQHRFCCYFK
jgi:hypothetical protein